MGTNNIAELVAIERGLALARAASTRTPTDACGSTAIPATPSGCWRKNWKAKANQELVAGIRRKLTAFPAAVEFVKVAGHAGVPENERCDELGRQAINRRSAVG